MRTFSSAVQALLASDEVLKYFFLVQIELDTIYRFTDLPYDITYNGNVFYSGGVLLSYEPPRQSSTVDREAYKITLADGDGIFLNAFRTGVIGKNIRVWAGFFDANDEPLIGTTDIINVYRGYIDSPNYQNDWGSRVVTIEGTSPMADLDAVNSIMVSRDGMDQRNDTDTSFDQIYNDHTIKVEWGKT